MVHGIFGHCEFSESGQIPHTDLEQQTKNAVTASEARQSKSPNSKSWMAALRSP